MATYTYSIANDFPSGKVNTTKLDSEIRASAITIALDRIDTAGDVISIVFKDDLSAGDKTILDNDTTGPAGGLIAAHDNTSSQDVIAVKWIGADGTAKAAPLDNDGNLKIVTEPLAGSKFNLMSVNWCDKCSWYEGSTKITDETLTDSGDGLTFNSSKTYWIDMKHGRITNEDNIVAANGNKWIVSVTSDNVAKTESPAGTTSADYQVNYEAGTITFNSSQAGKTVKATFWYAVTGTFTVKPLPGKKIKILYVEVQFSKNIVLNDSMVFIPYGYAGVFAPQYVPTPYAFTDLIPLQAAAKYKTRDDYVNESNGTYPLIPAFGGNGWRGSSEDVITLPWKYLTRTDLFSSYGMEIRISMENNAVMGGELATATFYCISENE